MNRFGQPIDRSAAMPAHTQVKDRILDLIRSGTLRQGERLPGEPELATMLGVSRMTANKAILALVGDGWLAREKGRGTFVAREAEPVATRRCAVVIPEDPARALDTHYFGGLYWPIHTALERHGIRTDVLRLTANLEAQEAEALIAINPPKEAIEELLRFQLVNGPVVVVGAAWEHYGLSVVDSDNLLGAAVAVNHLAELGHERVIFLGACPDTSNTIDRVRGFRTAMKSRGLRCEDDDILLAPTAFGFNEEIEAELSRRLTGANAPTAVFAAGAFLALQTQGLAHRLGLTVPERLSVIGYDDPEYLRIAYPAISTVRQPLAEMAEVACDLVVAQLRSGDPRPERRLLDPTLIIRGSTAPPIDHSNGGIIQ